MKRFHTTKQATIQQPERESDRDVRCGGEAQCCVIELQQYSTTGCRDGGNEISNTHVPKDAITHLFYKIISAFVVKFTK